MSAFDYPRLMLTGTAVCSPATGNNCKFVPLAIFDPVGGTCAIPPRLYLLDPTIEAQCLAQGLDVIDLTVDDKKYRYVEIAPKVLNDPEKFKEWALLPLGEYDGDKDYHEIYKKIVLKINGRPLYGNRPGYFNYYGTTEFEFRDVKVKSIALNASVEGEKIVKEKDGSEESIDLADLFNLELKINDGLTSKAKLVDAASSVSLATQIFWDKLSLSNPSEVIFSGKPYKASLRFASASRIPALQGTGGAHCGSGTFFSAIRIEDIENEQNNELLRRLFEKYKTGREEIIGLQIAFNLFEVKENVGLQMNKPSTNNAEAKVVVAITPWFKGDLKSISMGRQLHAGINYLKKCYEENAKISDYFLSPVVAQVNYEQHYLMLDLVNNIPETYVPDPTRPKEPPYPIPVWDDDRFETLDTGVLVCKLYESGKVLGEISIDRNHFSRQSYLDRAGKVVFYNRKIEPIAYKDTLLNDKIALYLYDLTTGKNLIGDSDTKDDYVMLESEYMLASDTGSLYASVNDDPAHGYRSYSGQKEPCRVTIYNKGFEYRYPIPSTVIRCEVKPWNLKYILSTYRVTHYKSNDVVSFPTEKAFNGLYLLYANIDSPIIDKLINEVYINGLKGWLWYYLMNYFNSYIALRVLPHQDYSEYLDFHKKGKRKQVTFDVLKKEIFDSYDLLYPVMSRIFPFEETAMRSYQDHIYNLMSLDNWENSSHMPVSRDLSPQQYRLFLEWMKCNDPSREGGAYHHGARMDKPIESLLNEDGIIPR